MSLREEAIILLEKKELDLAELINIALAKAYHEAKKAELWQTATH